MRFADRRRAWRRRFWWAFPLIAILPLVISLPIAVLTNTPHAGFLVGFGLGTGVAAAMVLFDSPPRHIESWRVGYEGEKDTARRLRSLVKAGWTLFNDIETGHGNIDHVLVGPPGVFVLESKRLSGRVRVEAGKLVVSWHEDPDNGYENKSVAGRTKRAAADLHLRLRAAGVDLWVQPVVVLWADFEQRSILDEDVAWVRGDQIAAVLAGRPDRLGYDGPERVASATRGAVRSLVEQAGAAPVASAHSATA